MSDALKRLISTISKAFPPRPMEHGLACTPLNYVVEHFNYEGVRERQSEKDACNFVADT